MFEGKPVIGVMPLLDEKRDSYWMLPGYMKGLEEQGAIPLMPPLTGNEDMLDYFLESCDGFILTGGQTFPRLCTGRSRPNVAGSCPDCGTAWTRTFCAGLWSGIRRCSASAGDIS